MASEFILGVTALICAVFLVVMFVGIVRDIDATVKADDGFDDLFKGERE